MPEDIVVDADSVEVERSQVGLVVRVYNVEIKDLLDNLDGQDILDYLGEDEVLNMIGPTRCIQHFDFELKE